MLRSFAVLLLLTTSASADTITSQKTDLFPTKCKEKGKPAEGQDPALRCPALPGYVVDVWYSAEDTHVQVSGKGTPVELRGHSIADQLEWRLAGGKPFAVIMSVTEIEDDAKGQPHLRRKIVLVRGLDGFATTINDEIEGNDEAAIKKARDAADALYKKSKTPKPAPKKA